MRRGFAILLVVAFASMLVVAYAQEGTEQPVQYETVVQYKTVPEPTTQETVVIEKQLPKSGGPGIQSVLLPAAALLVGSGVLAYAVLRRR